LLHFTAAPACQLWRLSVSSRLVTTPQPNWQSSLVKILRFWNVRAQEHAQLQRSIKDLESAVAALASAVESSRPSTARADTSDSGRVTAPAPEDRKLTLGPEDRKVTLVTFVATLAANVVTLAVGGIALLAYHLGPRLVNSKDWTGGLLLAWLAWIFLLISGHRVFDRWFLAGEEVSRLSRMTFYLYLCCAALVFVFFLFFILGKLISVK
jgi:hypothetical protein